MGLQVAHWDSWFACCDGYDRRGIGGADVLFFLNNAIVGDRTDGNVCFSAGMALAYGVENSEIVTFGLNAGFGYCHWFDKFNGFYGEVNIGFFSVANAPSATLAIGYQRRF